MQNFLSFLRKQKKYVVAAGIALIIGLFFIIESSRNNEQSWVTELVSKGDVQQIISVSGTVDATQSVKLSFPVSGTLESIMVNEGATVAKGALLATLVHDDLKAEYQDAYSSLLIAQADHEELLAGLRPEERTIEKTKVEIAEEELARVTKEQDNLVNNAHQKLLSTDLAMRPTKNSNGDTPPTISGTYTCAEGTYTIDMYNSGTASGYSFRLSGLEKGTYTGYTESAAPFGTCGLSMQLASDENYGNSTWTITIPNTESENYVTNKNAYALALITRANAIQKATQDLELAYQTNTLDLANPRNEALVRSNARLIQAESQVQKISALIAEHTLTAPFDGIVAHTEQLPGETVTNEPTVTLLSKNAFEISALIPEIDITKIANGQKASIVFDARANETFSATISFISPLAKEIAGVSYFETKLTLDTVPDWLQSGLNVDIDVIIDKHEQVTRIPRRFLIQEGNSYSVKIPDGKETKTIPVTAKFEGNDGFVQIEGVSVGDTIIAP